MGIFECLILLDLQLKLRLFTISPFWNWNTWFLLMVLHWCISLLANCSLVLAFLYLNFNCYNSELFFFFPLPFTLADNIYSCPYSIRVSLVAQLVKNQLQCKRPGFDPWVGKIPWRWEQLATQVFWPGEFHGLYRPWGLKQSDMTVQPWHLYSINVCII